MCYQINRKGEIIPEEIWRKRIATKERMEQASRIIANRIVKQYVCRKLIEFIIFLNIGIYIKSD